MKQAGVKDWNDMDTKEKVQYIMWRFVMHPRYTDNGIWDLRLIYAPGHHESNKWAVTIYDGKTVVANSFGVSAHAVLDGLLTVIEEEIE